jgi:hypothetical protein
MASRGHVGKAGHLAVMSEFLLRGYNVAMPEVDLGDDIFVVEDRIGRLWRVQVKTAIGKRRRSGSYEAKVAVSTKQLTTDRDPDLFYVLALRDEDRWEFLILPRKALVEEHNVHQVGSSSGGTILFTLRVTAKSVVCSKRDWQRWRGDWAEWPLIP